MYCCTHTMTTTAVELQLCSGTLTTEIRLYTQYSAYRLQLYTYVLYDLSIVLLGPEYNASCTNYSSIDR